MSLDQMPLANILEACLLVAGKPMSMTQLEGLFEHEAEKPDKEQIREAIGHLQQSYEDRGIELVEVASGFRLQARQSTAPWVTHMFQEKTPRYSRALMETLVLIAYRQPITRGEIEDVRGVAVSSNIIKTLLEREWVRVLGHRDVPGRPAILGTTRQFLDYFNLKRIDELPTLSEIKALDQIDPELAHEMELLDAAEAVQADTDAAEASPEDAGAGDVGAEDAGAGIVAEEIVGESTAANAGQLMDVTDQVDVEHVDLDLGENETIDDSVTEDYSEGEVTEEDGVSSSTGTPDERVDPDDDSTAHEPIALTAMGESETLH